jgi:hypothetical protein
MGQSGCIGKWDADVKPVERDTHSKGNRIRADAKLECDVKATWSAVNAFMVVRIHPFQQTVYQ